MTLQPLIAAIAGGNCCILKVSEVSANSAQVMANLVERYLDSRCYAVIQGAVPETTLLLEQKFDMIMYTGNTQVGKIIAAAAAKFLTPTILELGGKSPVIVDKKADIDLVAFRIMQGKILNAGIFYITNIQVKLVLRPIMCWWTNPSSMSLLRH